MDVNDRQVGGTHYVTEYQHWDFVTDTDLPYILGCATKYVWRWRSKNGREDLEKAIHYLEKAADRNVMPPWAGDQDYAMCCARFVEQCENPQDKHILNDILASNYMEAKLRIQKLLK